MTTATDSRAAALNRHLDTQIENLERKNYHNRELITDLKKQKLKIKDRLHSLTIREAKRSKKESVDDEHEMNASLQDINGITIELNQCMQNLSSTC